VGDSSVQHSTARHSTFMAPPGRIGGGLKGFLSTSRVSPPGPLLSLCRGALVSVAPKFVHVPWMASSASILVRPYPFTGFITSDSRHNDLVPSYTAHH
jgi:hypothetical protein